MRIAHQRRGDARSRRRTRASCRRPRRAARAASRHLEIDIVVGDETGGRLQSALTTARVTPRSTRRRPQRSPPPPCRSRAADRRRRRRCARHGFLRAFGAMRTWLITAPFFCARPVKSSTVQPLPSRCAAMPSSAPIGDDAGAADAGDQDTVGRVQLALVGQRQVGEQLAGIDRGAASSCASAPPCTVTKLGQKPLTQEKSLLQVDWSICRLRPNSVSSGLTETQFDCLRAIAAAFADGVVDEDALGRIGDRCRACAAGAFRRRRSGRRPAR